MCYQICSSSTETVHIVPTLYIHFYLFKASIRNTSCHSLQNATNVEMELYDNSTEEKHTKIKMWISKMCLVCAWILTLSSIAVGFFFTVMYSLSWGMEKSLGWMKAFFLSTFQFTALIDPIMVRLALYPSLCASMNANV